MTDVTKNVVLTLLLLTGSCTPLSQITSALKTTVHWFWTSNAPPVTGSHEPQQDVFDVFAHKKEIVAVQPAPWVPENDALPMTRLNKLMSTGPTIQPEELFAVLLARLRAGKSAALKPSCCVRVAVYKTGLLWS